MAFCTIVEFDWSDDFDLGRFENLASSSGAPAAEGRLARITGYDDSGARVIEVWRSGEDARAFAERSAGVVAQMPAPSRVLGFDVTSYVLS